MPSRTKYSITFLLLLCFSLTSCYHEIDLDKYRDEAGKNLLTLNSIINPDSPIAVSATETFFFSDKHLNPNAVPDLDILVTVNGENIAPLKYDAKTEMYVSDYKPNVGDVVELSTVYKGKEVRAKEQVPRQVPIEDITVSKKGPYYNAYGDRCYSFTYNITFSDCGNEENYYFIKFDMSPMNASAPGFNTSLGQINYSHNIVFQKLEDYMGDAVPSMLKRNPAGIPFSDDGIDGSRYTFVITEEIQEWAISKEIKRDIKLFSINKAYFEYIVNNLIYVESMDENPSGMIDLGLADPIRSFTNIENGLGIFGCYVLSQKRIDVSPLLFE